MQPYFRKEKRTVTPEKAVKILAQSGTIISLEKAGFMLDLLYKLSNLSVAEAISSAKVQQNTPPAKNNRLFT